MRRFALPLSAVLLTACAFSACGAPNGAAGPPSGPSPVASPVEPPATTGTGSYEVHEWGLMRAGPGDTLEVGAIGPGLRIEPMVAEKPVLYFHLDPDLSSLDLGVAEVVANDGTIREHWPLAAPPVGAADPARVSWAPLTLRATACALSVPTDRSICCGALPSTEVCESLLLARAATGDAACVETASGPSPLLFYRSTTRGLVVPLRAWHLDFGDINVRNDSDEVLPGMLVRFIQHSGGLAVIAVVPPAPHQTIVVGHEDQGAEAARAAIRRSLTELGLTESEAGAFLASWNDELFPATAAERIPSEESMPDSTTLLYFLPESMADRVSRLTFSPAPRRVRRALAVWTAVD